MKDNKVVIIRNSQNVVVFVDLSQGFDYDDFVEWVEEHNVADIEPEIDRTSATFALPLSMTDFEIRNQIMNFYE
jgi:hypothetical protein